MRLEIYDSKIIHDNVWGEIWISNLALLVIDTPEFQRLHYIHQTGCAYKVFPTAKTSRFEHSLGTYHITRLLLRQLGGHDLPCHPELICIGALCHDLGHGPFSHSFDKAFPDEDHEKRSVYLARRILKHHLRDEDLDTIDNVINPGTDAPWYFSLVKNNYHGLDTDKLDYIVRDNKAFGLHLDINVNRLLSNCKVINETLAFCDRVKDDVFNVFYVRYRLHREIYCHPKIVALEELIKDILQHTCAGFTMQTFHHHTDASVLIQCPQRNLVEQFEMRRVECEKPKGVSFRSHGVDGNPVEQVPFFSRKSRNVYYMKAEEFDVYTKLPF